MLTANKYLNPLLFYEGLYKKGKYCLSHRLGDMDKSYQINEALGFPTRREAPVRSYKFNFYKISKNLDIVKGYLASYKKITPVVNDDDFIEYIISKMPSTVFTEEEHRIIANLYVYFYTSREFQCTGQINHRKKLDFTGTYHDLYDTLSKKTDLTTNQRFIIKEFITANANRLSEITGKDFYNNAYRLMKLCFDVTEYFTDDDKVCIFNEVQKHNPGETFAVFSVHFGVFLSESKALNAKK